MNRQFILVANLILSILISTALSSVIFAISSHILLTFAVYSLSGASVLVALSVLMTRRLDRVA